MFDEKRPRVEKKRFVHHNDRNAVFVLTATGERVFDHERVTQHLAAVLVAKKYWTLVARIGADLEFDEQFTRIKCNLIINQHAEKSNFTYLFTNNNQTH